MKLFSILIVAALAQFSIACNSDSDGETVGTGDDMIGGGSGQSGSVAPGNGIGNEDLAVAGSSSGQSDMVATPSGGTSGDISGGGGVQPPVDSGAPDGTVMDTGGTEGPSDADADVIVADTGVTEAGTDPDFEACIATLEPDCKLIEMNTAEKMEVSCKAMTYIAIPLSNGGTAGPTTVPAGPYGWRIEWNEGAGTEFVNSESDSICPTVVASFGEPDVVNEDLVNLRGMDMNLYTIFRPACMKAGEKYPVISWANGTCGYTHGYAGILAHLASHGYVVISSNSVMTGSGVVQKRALDYAEALNADAGSIYYQKLDTDKIGAMGHSQGAGSTGVAASDARIKSIILWNGGTSNTKPFLNVSGERDITDVGASGMASATNGATQPGAWVYYNQVLQTGGAVTGHLVLMEQPERVVELDLAWWDWQLKGSQDAKNMFIGDNCGLCNRDAEFNYGHNSLLQ